jgi:hypothetical protein
MEPPIVTMDRRNRNYLNPSFPSGSKFHSLQHLQLKTFGKHHSPLPAQLRFRPSGSTSHHFHTGPRKTMAAIATKKRVRLGEPFCDPEYGQPLSSAFLVYESDHFVDTSGLELGEGPPTKKIHTGPSSSELDRYRHRMKKSSPGEAIRKRRVLVDHITSPFWRCY